MSDGILILTTGGTIDKVYFDAKSDYQVGQSVIDGMLTQAEALHPYRIQSILQKDSLDLTDEDRQLIRNTVADAPESRIVVTHGTDTMTDTAAILSALDDKAIVLTGSLAPARFAMTDAMFNVGMAFAAVQLVDCGVYIAMNGQIFPSDEVVKNREQNRFESR